MSRKVYETNGVKRLRMFLRMSRDGLRELGYAKVSLRPTQRSGWHWSLTKRGVKYLAMLRRDRLVRK